MNKKALITGASRGIGKAIAEEFAKQGYDLYLTCLSSINILNTYAEELSSTYHIQCMAYQADMGKYEDVLSVFAQINTLDVLVNNAGISYVGLLTDMTPTDWHKVMNTNLDACFYTSKLAIPLMLQKHSGRIINISSIWGNTGASMEVAYSASKGGVNSFTKALAKELAPSNIQVNTVACGLIHTDMNNCFTEEDLQTIIQEIPADRMGQPKEIAELVYQLATTPSYLTGQIITIDGGWT